MTTRSLYFITHPDVAIDPSAPIEDWPLSPRGLERMRRCARLSWVAGLSALYCSDERKAIDGAAVLASATGLVPVPRADLRENDRSSTGYLPFDDFRRTVAAFFERPEESVRGWAPAATEQRRVVAALERVIAETDGGGDVAVVGHGGVGALSLAHWLREPISIRHDQPGSAGGNVYRLSLPSRRIVHGWRPIDSRWGDLKPAPSD